MQNQSNLCENRQELLNSLIDIHPDLDLKLIQPQYDDNIDILRAAYLKVKMEGNDLNEISTQDLEQLTKSKLLIAKESYLKSLIAKKMQEQGTSAADIDRCITITEEKVKAYSNDPEKLQPLQESQDTLKELKFIKDAASYAHQLNQQQINYLEKPAQMNEEQKNESYADLMDIWDEENEPFEDLNTELKNVQDKIEKLKKDNLITKLQVEEKKHALLLRMIQARKSDQEPVSKMGPSEHSIELDPQPEDPIDDQPLNPNPLIGPKNLQLQAIQDQGSQLVDNSSTIVGQLPIEPDPKAPQAKPGISTGNQQQQSLSFLKEPLNSPDPEPENPIPIQKAPIEASIKPDPEPGTTEVQEHLIEHGNCSGEEESSSIVGQLPIEPYTLEPQPQPGIISSPNQKRENLTTVQEPTNPHDS